MFRTMLYTTVAALGLLAPMATEVQAAHGHGRPEYTVHRHRQHYHVMFRRCHHEAWREYGTYNCHELAHEVEEQLQRRGFEARVVHH